MQVIITPNAEQESFIRYAIDSGRLQNAEDVMQEALSQWQERERRRAEILGTIHQSELSLARGEGRKITNAEEAKALVEDVRRRGIARLTLEQTPP